MARIEGRGSSYALTMMQTVTCPACGSDRVVPIIYGFAGPDLAMQEQAGALVLGGCDITDNDPAWACRLCDERFY